jgi:hypothetical protein
LLIGVIKEKEEWLTDIWVGREEKFRKLRYKNHTKNIMILVRRQIG